MCISTKKDEVEADKKAHVNLNFASAKVFVHIVSHFDKSNDNNINNDQQL